VSVIGGKPLIVIGRIMRFLDGRTSLTKMELGLPAQPVYDISRQAALGSIETSPGAGGFFQVGQDNVHAAGGETVEGAMAVYSGLSPSWGTEGERWIWLMQIAGSVSSLGVMGAGSSARLALAIPALGSALARRDMLLREWDGAVTVSTTLSATFPAALTSSTLAMQNPGPTLPILIPSPGGATGSTLLTWRTVATAANPGTIRLSTLCWIGPTGVYPPGLG